MQEVLPKQAPDAAETNGKRDNIEKREKEKHKETKAEFCEAIQRPYSTHAKSAI